MKVGILIPRLVNCGPVNMALSIVKALLYSEKINFRIIVVHSERNDQSMMNYISKQLKVPVIVLNENNKVDHLVNICDSLDVVHSHGYYPDKLLSKINIKKITTIHCMFYKDYVSEYGIFKGLLASFLHFRYLKIGSFKYIVGCSQSVENYVKNHIGNLTTKFVNNGVDQNIFRKIDCSARTERLKLLGFNKFNRIFIFSGRLIRRKRVPELIGIFQNLFSHDDLLIIIGDGDEFNICSERKYNNVIFLGAVNNPEFYYQCADFVISNSSAEGYPMSIIEAVSCGCKALLSDIPPHRDFIKNNSSVACLINNIKFSDDFYDPKQLSSEIMAKSYHNLYLS